MTCWLVFRYLQLVRATGCRAPSSPAHVSGIDLQIGDNTSMPSGLGSPPYHHWIQEYVLLSDEEAPSTSPPQWTSLISGYSAPAVSSSHLLAIAITITLAITSRKTTVAACLHMVCTCFAIWTVTVAITISSTVSCSFHECHRCRRIVSFWRLCT